MPPKASKDLTYRDVLDRIKRKDFASVYLLMGDEPYYIDLIVDALDINADVADRLSPLYAITNTPWLLGCCT